MDESEVQNHGRAVTAGCGKEEMNSDGEGERDLDSVAQSQCLDDDQQHHSPDLNDAHDVSVGRSDVATSELELQSDLGVDHATQQVAPDSSSDDHDASGAVGTMGEDGEDTGVRNTGSSPADFAELDDGDDCVSLYATGKDFEQRDQLELALNCYVRAVDRMSAQTGKAFPELPDCLHRISNIYFLAEEYDKAVKFAKAEKLYYETALLGSVSPVQPGESSADKANDELLVERADEFERLSKFCLREKRPQLALDYCGKACKLHQKVYGDDHSKTAATLDMFATIYAEVGRKQYADALARATGSDAEPAAIAISAPSQRADSTRTRIAREAQLAIPRRQSQPQKLTEEVVAAASQSPSSAAVDSPKPSSKLGQDALQDDAVAASSAASQSDSSGTDSAKLGPRQAPAGESDHGSQSSQASPSAARPTGNQTFEELKARRERIDAQEDVVEANQPPGTRTLVVFFVLSCVVAIAVSVLWCRWAQTPSCRATQSFVWNFNDHAVHIRNKAILLARHYFS